MHKQKSVVVLCILFIAALVSFLPMNAHAVSVKLESWINLGSGLDGRQTGTLTLDDSTALYPTYWYCIERNQHVYQNQVHTGYTFATITTTPLLQAAWLLDNYGFGQIYSTLTTADQTSVAAQLAVWNILGVGWPSGTGTLYNSLTSAATSMILTLPSDLSSVLNKYVLLHHDTYQDLLIKNNTSYNVPNVPIPPTVWLLGAGLLGLVGLRRKFRK